MLASDLLEDDGYSTSTVTILVPDMNFSCDGILAGFSFSGINRLVVGKQDPRIQIWRKYCDISEPDVYHKIGHAIVMDISSEDVVCADRIKIASRTHWCILNDDYRLSVQPGDILGLELPPMHDNDLDILFTRGRGPNNYVFRQHLNSTMVTLLDNHEEIQQLPQIAFSVTSGKYTISVSSYT